MSVISDGRWLTVTVLAASLGAAAGAVEMAAPVAADHAWMLAALVIATAVTRALGSGGPRSVLALALVVLLTQPVLHVVGELAPTHGGLVDGRGAAMGLLLLACHISLCAALVAGLAAGESAWRSVAAGLGRLARVLVRLIMPASEATTATTRFPDAGLSYEQRACAPQPPRRGPPLLSHA